MYIFYALGNTLFDETLYHYVCGQRGHPTTHCPDLWRRYHNTIDTNTPLVENRQTKKNHQLHCSGCTRRGHLVHTCRVTLPFSGLPINSPYVALYRPIYVSDTQNLEKNQRDTTITSVTTPRSESNKRQSKSLPCTKSTQ
ncbi:hypothetical protein evm_013056 [Chilo suppressalis]|nr:hypothetical protein evm_013056 [Chilo suppressalis]